MLPFFRERVTHTSAFEYDDDDDDDDEM